MFATPGLLVRKVALTGTRLQCLDCIAGVVGLRERVVCAQSRGSNGKIPVGWTQMQYIQSDSLHDMGWCMI